MVAFQVTILILIDGFLQLKILTLLNILIVCHNPYFNRWFSAIYQEVVRKYKTEGHNPYFNRWFSAIRLKRNYWRVQDRSQSLF